MVNTGKYWLAQMVLAGQRVDVAKARAAVMRASGLARAAAAAEREASRATVRENYADWQYQAYGWAGR